LRAASSWSARACSGPCCGTPPKGRPDGLGKALARTLEPLLRSLTPTRFEARETVGVEGEAQAAAQSSLGGASAESSTGFAASVALGADRERSWFEVVFGGEFKAKAAMRVLPELEEVGLGAVCEQAGQLDRAVKLRVERAQEAAGAPRHTFSITTGSEADRETRAYADARSVLARIAQLAGLRASAAPRGKLPHISLSRTLRVEVEAPEAQGLLGRLAGKGAGAIGEAGFVAGVREAHVEATVHADTLAALTALDAGGTCGELVEEDLLEGARAVIASVLGRRYESDLPVDGAAGAGWADVHATLEARSVLAAGVGAKGSVPGVMVSGNAGVELAVTERLPVEDRAEIARVCAA
jgi:hypothetical protein